MSISAILTTNCTVIDSTADIQVIREVFNNFPNQFLPVMEGERFVGGIFREDFLREFMFNGEESLVAADLVSKEMVKLHLRNSLAEAKEVFNSCSFDMVPVVDSDNNLEGIVLREDLEEALATHKTVALRGWRKVISLFAH